MSKPSKTIYPFALLSAGLLWLGLPGGGEIWPVLFVALVPLLLLTSVDSAKARFLSGLGVGLVHFLLQLYWIVIVLGRYGGLGWYFSYPATVLLSLYMAIYFGLFVLIAGGVLKRWGAPVFLVLAPLLWVGLDWLRGVLFSGLPWMDLGYGLWQSTYLLQVADIFGHHFLTFLIVLGNAVIFLAVQRKNKKAVTKAFSLVAVVFLCVGGYGYFRLAQLDERLAQTEKIRFGIVQGNIDQSMKWEPAEQKRTVDSYVQLTRTLLDGEKAPQLVVWPETALPFYPSRSPLFDPVPHLANEANAAILTGSPWFETVDAKQRIFNFYNGALLLPPDGKGIDLYFKSHLVPFGEYVPLRKVLFFLGPLVETVGDFTPGKIEKPLTYKSARCGVLICFESIFPEITRKWVGNGANVLINLTNDAWYGRSSAPHHSMAMSVLRAVESRRSLVRAANTGISGFVDPLGRVEKSSDIFVTWAESRNVFLLEEMSFHSRYGYLFGRCCFFLTAMVGVLLLLSSGRRKSGLS